MIAISDLYQIYLEQPLVCTDSRQAKAQSLFFALKGENFDGNRYAHLALEAGSRYAVVDDPQVVQDERYLLVPDVLLALQQLAAYHRQQLGIPIIAITGTNGKTTNKELAAAVLSQGYKIHFTQGNLNNHIGVPLTLLGLRAEHQLAIVEMGANKPGDIKELVEICRPNYALITNIGKAHLEGFGSEQVLRQTKGELYDYIRAHGGVLFLHAGDDVLGEMAMGLQSIRYGSGADALVQGQLLASDDAFLSFAWQFAGQQHVVKTKLIGSYNLPNALAAVCMGLYFDVASEAICEALSQYTPSNNRSQLIETARGNKLIADAYNANPSSMKAALDSFDGWQQELAKVLILGDMNELGASSEAEHEALLRRIASGSYRRVLLCGPAMSQAVDTLDLHSRVECFDRVESLLAQLQAEPIEQALILLKASRGIQLEKLIELC